MNAPDPRADELVRAAIDGPRDRLDAVILEANRWLADPVPQRRKIGLEILGHVSAFRGYRPSADMLRNISDCARDPEPIVRGEAACTLSLVPNAPAEQRAQILLKLLDDDDSGVREEAAAAAGDLKLEGAAEILARRLEDPSARVRIESAIALGVLKDPRAFEVLVEMLEREGGDRVGASMALAELGDRRAVAPLQKLASKWLIDFNERLHALGALYRLGERDAGAKIIARIKSWMRPEKHVALWMIGHARVEEGASVLLQIAQAKKGKLREAAIRGLGEFGDARAVSALETLALDKSESLDLRWEATAALGEKKNEASLRALAEIAARGEQEIADAAREMMQNGTEIF